MYNSALSAYSEGRGDVSVSEARARLADVVDKARIGRDPVFLTRLQWDIDRIERDYPDVKLSATKEMMVG